MRPVWAVIKRGQDGLPTNVVAKPKFGIVWRFVDPNMHWNDSVVDSWVIVPRDKVICRQAMPDYTGDPRTVLFGGGDAWTEIEISNFREHTAHLVENAKAYDAKRGEK